MKLKGQDQFKKQLHLLHIYLAIILKFYQNLEILSEQLIFTVKLEHFQL